MAKFKVGDRVRLTGPEWGEEGTPRRGEVVTLVESGGDGEGSFRFADSDGFDGWYTYDESCPDAYTRNCWSAELVEDDIDLVNEPPHYKGANGIEAIDVIEAFDLNYRLGNVVKYVLRHKSKGGVESLKKAEFYLRREIEAWND